MEHFKKNKSTNNVSMPFIFIILFSILYPCTIGGAYDDEGRPYIFKVRDRGESNRDNKLYHNTSGNINYVGNIKTGTSNLNQTWMGINEEGLAIVNAVVSDDYLDDNYLRNHNDNGKFMHDVLSTFETLEQFENHQLNILDHYENLYGNFILLDNSSPEGEQSKLWLYEVMIEDGEILIFHGNSINNITKIEPDSFICRSNFIFNSNDSLYFGDNPDDTESKAKYRYLGCEKKLQDIAGTDELSSEYIFTNIIRLFRQSSLNSNGSLRYYDVPFEGQVSAGEGRPYGYISTLYSIARDENISSVIIRGTIDGENKQLTTMWTQLGNSASAIPVPIWPIDSIPYELNGYNDSSTSAPLCIASESLRGRLYSYPEISGGSSSHESYIDSYQLRNNTNTGIWDSTLNTFFTDTEDKLFEWSTAFDSNDIIEYQNSVSTEALNLLNNISPNKPEVICDFEITSFIGNTIEVYDKSLHCPITWSWNIPEPDRSLHDQNSELNYNNSGTFIINLEVTDSDNNFDNSFMALGCTNPSASNFNDGNDINNYNDLCENSSIVGDINFDNNIDVIDISHLINKIINVYPFTESFDKNDDLNNDDAVHISDILVLIDIVLGI